MLKSLFQGIGKNPAPAQDAPGVPRVLNVGGGDRGIPLTPHYDAWTRHWLDVDPVKKPDIVCDGRRLETLAPGAYEAVYCSHNLEHYYHHETVAVLRGFLHVLKADGFAHVRVPNIECVLRHWVERKLDLDDEISRSAAGANLLRDYIWGSSAEIERSGQDFYAHKNGFTPRTLTRALEDAGFAEVFMFVDDPHVELSAVAFKMAGPNRFKRLFDIG